MADWSDLQAASATSDQHRRGRPAANLNYAPGVRKCLKTLVQVARFT